MGTPSSSSRRGFFFVFFFVFVSTERTDGRTDGRTRARVGGTRLWLTADPDWWGVRDAARVRGDKHRHRPREVYVRRTHADVFDATRRDATDAEREEREREKERFNERVNERTSERTNDRVKDVTDGRLG